LVAVVAAPSPRVVVLVERREKGAERREVVVLSTELVRERGQSCESRICGALRSEVSLALAGRSFLMRVLVLSDALVACEATVAVEMDDVVLLIVLNMKIA
jgi:hypothetical protein